jgi:3-methyl-2-oxobutanoate hydroxymethyltransferase
MGAWTANRIRELKGKQKFACLTAADCPTARRLDEAGIPLILVGDSLAMTVLGYDSTLPVTMEDMIHHTAAVVRGVKNALVVGDMPFLSYQVSVSQAIENAGRFLKRAGAGAVKIEGGVWRAETVQALVHNGIPVLGHIGLTPHSVRGLGGYRVQGKAPADAQALVEDAQALERAGVFALVVECVPSALGGELTRAVSVPTIGIGAGPACDGQILVTHDLLGLSGEAGPRFVKRYARLGDAMKDAFEAFRREVEQGQFPSSEHSY